MPTALRLLMAAVAIVAFPLLLIGLISLAERGIRLLVRNWHRQEEVRAWVWMAPGLLFMGTVLFYPLAMTLWWSFRDDVGDEFVGLDNFSWALTSGDVTSVLRNTALWVVLLPVVGTTLGLLVAVLADKVRYERLAKTVIVLPMAISFVAGAAIWRQMYQYKPPEVPQIGTVNAVWTLLGFEPVVPLVGLVGVFAMIWIAVWVYVGFAALVISAGLKGIPQEVEECAVVDGASQWQLLIRIRLPLLWPVIVVVLTTLFVWALRIFDIVFVLTAGYFDTDVIAHRVYHELFQAFHLGRGSVLAVLLFIAVLPVMVFNARRIRRGAGVAG